MLEKGKERYKKLFPLILHQLFNQEIIEEDAVWSWKDEHEEEEEEEILKISEKFLQWLKEAEDEEDEEEEEEDD